jgi:HTH-type transcriptional regulator/antitoxin HigA
MNYSTIESEEQYDQYCKKLRELAEMKSTNATEGEMELIEIHLETWEKENYKKTSLDPIALLKGLLENHNITYAELGTILGVSTSLVDQILSYEKGLSEDVILKLSKHFCMSQEAFNRPYYLILGE